MSVPNNANVYLPGTIQIPSSIVITNITNSYPMVITVNVDDVTESNVYIPGMLVKLLVPVSYQMIQANGLTGQILSVSGSDISVDIDSRGFDIFVIPSNNQIPASLAPAGSRNLQYNNTTRNVPFQSLNNRGN